MHRVSACLHYSLQSQDGSVNKDHPERDMLQHFPIIRCDCIQHNTVPIAILTATVTVIVAPIPRTQNSSNGQTTVVLSLAFFGGGQGG